MQQIKERKVALGYWSDFAKANGQPVWDKSIIISSNANSTSFANAGTARDTVYYIPLVLENDTIVNGFIEARVKDSVQLGYRLAQDYVAYKYELNNRESAVSLFITKLIALNNNTFGYSKFYFRDQKIFSEDTVHHKSLSIEIDFNQFNFVSSWCASTTSTFLNCPWPEADDCINGCDYLKPCDASPRCGLINLHNSICITVDDGIGTIPGNTGGQSGVYGTIIPHLFPCENPIGCLPPPHNGGPFITILNEDPQTLPPCDPLIKGLETNQSFINKFKSLKDNPPIPDDRETMYTTTNLVDETAYNYTPGIPNTNTILFPQESNIVCIVHRHNFGLNDMFSTEDFWNFVTYSTIGSAANTADYFWGMVGPNGFPYLIRIKDKARLVAWRTNPAKTFASFDEKYYRTINRESSGDDSRQTYNEVGFLNMIKKEELNEAVDLYIGMTNSGNPAFNKWQKLATDSRNSYTVNCQ